ncbi:hypothetical protein ACHAW6_007655 [Cyclotella cf. meneghiniana]
MSIRLLADNVTVHDQDDVAITTSRLRRILLINKFTNLAMHKLAIDQLAPSNVIHHVFELPSMSKMVRYLHAALGFPKKATLLTAAKHGNLTTFLGLTVENITKYFQNLTKLKKDT